PSRPGSRPTSSPKPTIPTIDLVTPAPPKKTAPLEPDDVDDGVLSEDDVMMEDELAEDKQHSDDEYDELSQKILRSQSNAHELEDDLDSTTRKDQEVEVEDQQHEIVDEDGDKQRP